MFVEAIFTNVEQLLETIDIDVDVPNELLFKVKVEGLDPSPAKVRLVCSSEGMSYMFDGVPSSDDVVQFNLPVLKGKLKEGLYQSKVEVLIENRYFAPVQFNINVKKVVSVFAEAVKRPQNIITKNEVSVTAVPLIAKRIAEKVQHVENTSKPKQEVITKADENLIRTIAKEFVRGKK